MHHTKDTGMTAMHWAAYNQDPHVIRLLLKEGSQPFKFSHMGRLAIDVAGSCKAYECVDVFLDGFRKHVIQRPRPMR